MSSEQMDTGYPKIDLIEIIGGVVRSALHMLIPGLLAVALLTGAMTFYMGHSYTPRYQASASFTVRVANPLYADQQYYNNAAAEQMAKTFPHILTSGVLSEQVKQELDIRSMPSVSAEAMGNTNIFTLKVTASDPQLAYDVLGSVTRLYPNIAEFVVGPTEITFLSESGVPTSPTNHPNRMAGAVMGAFAGFALWGGAAFLYWITHRTVATEEELSKVINVPCLGHLPKVRGLEKSSKKCPILSEKNDKFGFNESVRLLRVRVEKEMGDTGNVLMVTSTIPNEGKTTVSVNLAAALAQKGKKVLLLDCDLRNPSVGAIFGLDGQMGFTEYLQGKCTLREASRMIDNKNFCVIPGGTPTSSPEQMLSKLNAKKFVEAAKNNFDYVILDTPPCALLADASEIAMMADRILLTVRQNFACRQQILDGVQILGDCGKPIIGTVLNMTTPRSSKGSYYNYYGYGYGYGYGSYGSYGADKKDREEEA